MKASAKWTDDCQRKKDYDGEILTISTRYWPRGGGMGIITHNKNGVISIETNSNQDIKPSATSTICLNYGDDDYLDLITEDFEAETETEVKNQVEKWVQEQFNSILELLKTKYKIDSQ